MKAIHKVRKIESLRDMLEQSVKLYSDRPAYKFKTEEPGIIRTKSYKDFKEEVDALGTALVNLGLNNKKIAVISENRYEWCLSYLAITTGTGIVVPLDRSLPANEIKSLIMRSGVEGIIYSEKYNEVMNEVKLSNESNLTVYISMDLTKEEDGILSTKELVQVGKKLIKKGNKEFLDAKIDVDGMGIMLFTSGTTSRSKAVMLSQKNICSNLMDIASVIKVDQNDTLLSFLPLHHTFECTVGFLYTMYAGAALAFCDGIRHIAENIKEYKITAMISVPALYESMYRQVMKGIEKKGKTAKVQKGIKITKFFRKFGIDLRRRVFKDIHENFGGELRLFVNGAAALDKDVEEGFNNLGIRTVQGYGTTETSPVLAAGNDKFSKYGSVGKAFPNVEIKIINPNEQGIGEIIAKGPNVMLGYYENQDATSEVIKDGWFYTGDLGYLDEQEYLFLVGRKKNVLVLKNGKNIYPEELENLVDKIPGVKESMVYGKSTDDDDLKICVKLVYDKENIKNIYNTENEEELQKIIWGKIKEINKTMPAYKYIKELAITSEEFIKTTTQKVKRHEEMAKIEKKK